MVEAPEFRPVASRSVRGCIRDLPMGGDSLWGSKDHKCLKFRWLPPHAADPNFCVKAWRPGGATERRPGTARGGQGRPVEGRPGTAWDGFASSSPPPQTPHRESSPSGKGIRLLLQCKAQAQGASTEPSAGSKVPRSQGLGGPAEGAEHLSNLICLGYLSPESYYRK